MGGAKAAAQVLEDMIMFGHLDHLVPLEEKSSWVANTNADIYGIVFLLLFLGFYGMKTIVQKVLAEARRGGGATKVKSA
jgi:hypothetical protein